jgi:hypothetical protein
MKVPIEKCHHCVGSQTCENQVVNECLPVCAFGDTSSGQIKIATIGFNPALDEFFSKGLSKDKSQRLAILSDYHLSNRADLSETDIADAKKRRESYFREDREWHSHFEKLESMFSRIQPKWSYVTGRAVHIDLVACATKVRWGALSRECQTALVSNCRNHFLASLDRLPDQTLLMLDGIGVVNEMKRLSIELPNFKFEIEKAENISSLLETRGIVGKLKYNDQKTFPFRGWSMPVGRLPIIWRYDLARWVCETFDPPYLFPPTS